MAPIFLAILFSLTFVPSTTTWARSNASESKPLRVPSHRDIWRNSAGAFSGDIFLLPKRGNFLLEDKDFKPESMEFSSVNGRMLPPHSITMHGFAWDYDLEIPLVFKDPKGTWIKPGSYSQFATQQDIAPTLAKILDVPLAARKSGRILSEMLQSTANKKPKVVLVFVQDQMGDQYLKAHPKVATFYESFIKSGADFGSARVSHVDVETSVGHVAVGTGAWPPEHGVSGNDFFHSGIWKQVKAFNISMSGSKKDNLAGNPSFLFTPTLGDIWLQATEGKAIVFSQVYALRAAIGMAGHGAMFGKGFKSHAVWMDESADTSDVYLTNEQLYALPNSHRGKSVRPYVEKLTKETAGAWMGHELISKSGAINANAVRSSPAGTEWEGDLAIAAIRELKIGQDEVTDLVYINTKATDACGHRYGYESDECRQVLAVTDKVSETIYNEISSITGGEFIAVLTADHGAAPLPEVSGATRFSRQRFLQDLNTKFDARENHVDSILAVTSSQVYLNQSELIANGHKVSDVVQFIKKYQVPFEAPFNALAADWIKKGKAPMQRFFEDVASKEDLVKSK